MCGFKLAGDQNGTVAWFAPKLRRLGYSQKRKGNEKKSVVGTVHYRSIPDCHLGQAYQSERRGKMSVWLGTVCMRD